MSTREHALGQAFTFVSFVAMWTRLAKACVIKTSNELFCADDLMDPVTGLVATGQRCIALSQFVPLTTAASLSHHLNIHFHPTALQKLKVHHTNPYPPPPGQSIPDHKRDHLSPLEFCKTVPISLNKAKRRPSRDYVQKPDEPPVESINFRFYELVPVELGLFVVAFLGLCGRGSMKDAHLASRQKVVMDTVGHGSLQKHFCQLFTLAYHHPLGVSPLKTIDTATIGGPTSVSVPKASATETTTEAGAESDLSVDSGRLKKAKVIFLITYKRTNLLQIRNFQNGLH